MANKDTLIKMFEGIRDERTKHANTARRIGNAFLSMLDFASSAGDGKLSSVHDDIAQGFITFVKGLMSNQLAQLKGGASFGSDGSYSFDKDGNLVIESARSRDFDEMLQNGFALKRNPTSGKYTLSISDLIVWGRMVINTLEVRKKYAIGGNVYLSGASSKLQHVEKVYSEDGETVVGYKCYILKDDGTMATQNNWVVGDQALCQTFDIEEGVYQNVSNQYYWRLVTQVSEENVAITEKYIDKDGNEQIRELYEGQKFAWVVLSRDDCDTNSGIPASGDTIVLDGHRLTENEDTDYTERTNVLMLEATGSGSPRIIALTGIVDYKHDTDNEVFILSPQKVIFTTEHFEIRTVNGAPITFVHFMGPWVKGTEYHYYDQVSHANALWTCIVEKGKSTTDEPMDGSTYWRKEMSGGKGEKGDDAVSYNINFVTYKDDVHNDTLLYVYVVRSVGKESTSTLISNIPEISETAGLEVRVYCDGDYNENLTNHVKWSGFIQRSAWETVKNFEVRLYLNDKLVTSNSYSFGEQGESALEIIVTPETLVFDTGDDGLVPSGTSKQASISCYRNGVKVTNVSYSKSAVKNCSASVSESNGSATVTISEITSQEVADKSGNSSTISNTSGYVTVQVWDKDTNLYHRVQVKFMVNVAKFTGQMVNTNKRFSLKHEELANDVKDKVGSSELRQFKGEITQTAREISLSVSEKAVGRRNMLVGSACRKYGDGFMYMSGGYYDGYPLEQIEKNSGIDGVNCIHCRTKQIGTGSYYLSGFGWHGVSPQGNIKLEKGKNYVLSFYAKTHTPNNIYFQAEVLYQGSKIDTSRPAGYYGPTGYNTTFAASEAGKWELFTVKVSVPSDAKYEYVEINIFARARNYSFVSGYICKPMLEEGENYNGWTLSEQDYDYVGGNLLDNARTLDKSGTLVTINDTVIQNGYGTDSACIKNLIKANATLSDYKEVLRWVFGSTYLVNGNDYIFSFVAKADVNDARVVCYMRSGDIENSCDIFTEGNGGTWDSRSDGYVVFILSRQWTRYWVHWRPKDGHATPKDVIIRHTGNNSTSTSTVYVTQPKLEIGATMTEWTERKTDLVDKASLKAAGIEITSEQVTLYGNKVQVKTPKANPSEGYDEAAMFQNGKLNAQFINAGEVVSEGINAKKITATKLNVTGDSKIGIWHITKVDGWGDVMQAEGTKYNGATVVSGIQYCPLFVRGGSPNTAYFRVGASCTEFSYQSTLNHFNAVWFGNSARIVCKGSANDVNLPTNYDYNTQYEPVQYIFSEQSKKDSPALAINVIAKGFSGTPTAIQTNGAIRGVLAPNVMSISWSQTISNGVGVVICTNSYDITLTLPVNPVEGQTLIIIQGSSGNVYIVPPNGKEIHFGGSIKHSSDIGNNRFRSGMRGQFNILVFINDAWQLQFMNNRP